MKALYSLRFLKQYSDAPAQVQKVFDRQIKLLLENLRHPSLQAKKYDVSHDVWQGRVNRDWRFYFSIVGDTYHFHTIIPHPK